MLLNDRQIREALIAKLENQLPKPKAVIEELRVHNGNAIADVVALHNDAHCYEIKGVNDKIERVAIQGNFYNSAFRKITLVTTENHLKKALKITPKYWGIIISSYDEKKLLMKYHRGARVNPDFNKELALLTLWKSEMLSFVEENKHKRAPRDFLAQLISNTKKKAELSSNICDALLSRYISQTAK